MDDFNLDINSSGIEKIKLEEFSNLFDVTNLIHTYCTKNHKSTIPLIRTKRPLYFRIHVLQRPTLAIIIVVFQLFSNIIR